MDFERDRIAPSLLANMLVDTPSPAKDDDVPPTMHRCCLIRPAVEHGTTGPTCWGPRNDIIAPAVDCDQNAKDGDAFDSSGSPDGEGGYANSDNDDSSSDDDGDSAANEINEDTDGPMDDVILDICGPSTCTDPCFAVNPSALSGCCTAFLVLDRLLSGTVPPGPHEGTQFTLAPPFTTQSSKYITQACVVCTLLPAGYVVHLTAPPATELEESTNEYTTRRLFQRDLCYEGYWIVDTQGRRRHSQHF